MRRTRALVLGAWLACVAACGGSAEPPDAARLEADAAARCVREADCSNDVFCDGIERCEPDTEGADDRGCVRGTPPCMAGQVCDDVRDQCRTMCAVTLDADGDGALAPECGGNDCDDADPMRAPGGSEVCDAAGHDEDCDPLTVGARDVDGDDAIDVACCNRDPAIGAICGTDCDDSRPDVRVGAVEACNETDDDCDGAADEGVERSFWPDVDRDGWGDRASPPMRACTPPADAVENTLDCDDSSAAAAPGRSEECNALDDDCDGTIDEATATAAECAGRFGTPPDTMWACTAGACEVRCAPDRSDCDAEPSNGCETDLTSDVQHCGACGRFCGVGGECTASTCDEVVDVEAGSAFSCVVRGPSGRVVCWGNNATGALGDGTLTTRRSPGVVSGISGISRLGLQTGRLAMAEPPRFACAQGGTGMWCWGGETRGQLGNGEPAVGFSTTPVPVAGVPRIDLSIGEVRGMSVGTRHACAVQVPSVTGTEQVGVDCWGSNESRAIDATTTTAYASPVPHLPAAIRRAEMLVAAGVGHTCTYYLQYGAGPGTPRLGCIGSLTGSFTDRQYQSLESGADFTCGLSSGTPYCFGQNTFGQLGVGDTAARTSPTQVLSVTDATALSVGYQTACVLRPDRTVWCWGDDQNGLVTGAVTFAPVTSPRQVPGLTNVIDVSIGETHACALVEGGDVYCWGTGLGTGPTESTTPTLVPDL